MPYIDLMIKKFNDLLKFHEFKNTFHIIYILPNYNFFLI